VTSLTCDGERLSWNVLEALTRLFDPGEASRPEDRERDLRLATAALFFEVVRADGTVGEEERRALRSAVESTFDIPPTEIDGLLRAAEEKSREAASLYEFTHLVDQRLGPEDKVHIVELLWSLAFADGRKDPLEEHLVRTVAGLLHVSHAHFIDAKIRARSRR
jgi:uncharacterized tellurite resistance protein B-like protein